MQASARASSCCFLLFCVLCLCYPVLGAEKTVYVCGSTGSDTNDCSTAANACASVSGALSSLSGATSLTLNVCEGNYNGTENTNIVLPDFPVYIQTYEGDEQSVLFDCLNTPSSVFTASDSLSIYDINFVGCDQAITFQSEKNSSLIVNNSHFANSNTGIAYNAPTGVLNADSCSFSEVGVSIQVNGVEEFTLSNGIFITGTEASIVLSSTTSTFITISDTMFQDTMGVQFVVNEETRGSFSGCTFDAIHSPIIIDINGGSWYLERGALMYSSLCETGIVYNGAGAPENSLLLYVFNITTCKNAIEFNADASFEYSNGFVNTNETCFDVKINTGVRLVNMDLRNCLKHNILVNYTGKPTEIFIQNVNCVFANALEVITASESSGFVSGISFSLGAKAFIISGGQWNISNAYVVGYIADFRYDGGLAYLHSGEGLASFAFNDCVFSGGYSSYKGGVIYAKDVQSFNVSSCLFTNNGAQTGGAIYLDQFDYFSIQDSTFDECYAEDSGGAIDIESYNGIMISAFLSNVTFTENEAKTGSAISCCGTESEESCDVTLVYQYSDSVTLEDNKNTDSEGEDVSCSITYQNSGDAPGNSSSRDTAWVYWVILGSMVGLIISGSLLALAAYFLNKKRMSYVRMD